MPTNSYVYIFPFSTDCSQTIELGENNSFIREIGFENIQPIDSYT